LHEDWLVRGKGMPPGREIWVIDMPGCILSADNLLHMILTQKKTVPLKKINPLASSVHFFDLASLGSRCPVTEAEKTVSRIPKPAPGKKVSKKKRRAQSQSAQRQDSGAGGTLEVVFELKAHCTDPLLPEKSIDVFPEDESDPRESLFERAIRADFHALGVD